jgi:hypothetical protein
MLKEGADKKLLVTGGMIILCLFLFAAFPTGNIFQKLVAYITFLVAVPLLYVKMVLKESLKDYGFQRGNWKKGVLWGGLSLMASLAIFYLLLNYANFAYNYQPSPLATEKFTHFVLYEIFLVGFYVFMYEWFFRGFVMFSFSKEAKYWSIIIQFILFLAFIIFAGGAKWSIAYYIIIAPLAGFTAYQSRSLAYSLASSWIFIIIADTFIIKMLK